MKAVDFCIDFVSNFMDPNNTSGLQTETPLLEITFLKIRLDDNSKEVLYSIRSILYTPE